MNVKNKKIIVTGAGSGIGMELVLQLLTKGADVAALDINEEGLKNLIKKSNNCKNLTIFVVDISNDNSLLKFKKEYFQKHTVVDGLINNAGIVQPFVSVNKLEIDLANKIMNVNFFGPLKLTKLFLPELLNRPSGHIVNVSSMGGFFPFPLQTIYGASKAAIKLFTEGLYAELLNTNVKVMIVFPGAVATDILKNSKVKQNSIFENSTMKMTSAKDAATAIIKGMEKEKFKLYIGIDSKVMNLMYKFNAKAVIKFINKKMRISEK